VITSVLPLTVKYSPPPRTGVLCIHHNCEATGSNRVTQSPLPLLPYTLHPTPLPLLSENPRPGKDSNGLQAKDHVSRLSLDSPRQGNKLGCNKHPQPHSTTAARITNTQSSAGATGYTPCSTHTHICHSGGPTL